MRSRGTGKARGRRAAIRSSRSRACPTRWSLKSSGCSPPAADPTRGASGRPVPQDVAADPGLAWNLDRTQMAKRTKGATAAPARRKASTPARRAARAAPAVPARGKLERVRMPAHAARHRGEGQAAEDSNAGRYVYCIIKSERPLSFGPLGIGSEPTDVHTVHFRDIAAVVSNTPMVVQDPTRDNVLAHQRVNETVMQQHTVIPMSFGTVFKTDDDIIELLRSAYDAFTDVLNKMQDKFEFGLKVLWDRDQIIREIEEEDEDIRRLKE